MKKERIIWLASYPRSGNTLLRIVLWHCFGFRSASVYPNDLGGNKELERQVGHIEHGADGQIRFPSTGLQLIKTHEHPLDDNPGIYVVRDGRAACLSLWHFYNKALPLEAIIAGKHRFGTWCNHLTAWKPWERRDTLLLKYEEMTAGLRSVLAELSRFLEHKIIADQIPSRDSLAAMDGRTVRKKSDLHEIMTDHELELFDQVNGKMMRKMGYS